MKRDNNGTSETNSKSVGTLGEQKRESGSGRRRRPNRTSHPFERTGVGEEGREKGCPSHFTILLFPGIRGGGGSSTRGFSSDSQVEVKPQKWERVLRSARRPPLCLGLSKKGSPERKGVKERKGRPGGLKNGGKRRRERAGKGNVLGPPTYEVALYREKGRVTGGVMKSATPKLEGKKLTFNFGKGRSNTCGPFGLHY